MMTGGQSSVIPLRPLGLLIPHCNIIFLENVWLAVVVPAVEVGRQLEGLLVLSTCRISFLESAHLWAPRCPSCALLTDITLETPKRLSYLRARIRYSSQSFAYRHSPRWFRLRPRVISPRILVARMDAVEKANAERQKRWCVCPL